jgi:hypothetical protein
MRPFSNNDELNAHVDWCLSREAIRSAQAEGDKTKQTKPESRTKGIQEWWKAPSVEGAPRIGEERDGSWRGKKSIHYLQAFS